MVFKPGHKDSVKLKTDELKIQAYEQYCEYIASGKSKEGWYFEHPELTCCWRTMENYIKDNPDILQPQKKAVAECKSFAIWETKGTNMMDGLSKAETALYQMFMRNKFGWDKEDKSKQVDIDADKKLAVLGEFFSKFHSQPAPKADKEPSQDHS